MGVGKRVFLMEMSLFREKLNCDLVGGAGPVHAVLQIHSSIRNTRAAPGFAADPRAPNHRFLIATLVTEM
jgi:hypothetical protein